MMQEFTVHLYDEKDAITVHAFEMDIVDGTLVFSGVNRGGYIAAYAPSHWVSVTSTPESRL